MGHWWLHHLLRVCFLPVFWTPQNHHHDGPDLTMMTILGCPSHPSLSQLQPPPWWCRPNCCFCCPCLHCLYSSLSFLTLSCNTKTGFWPLFCWKCLSFSHFLCFCHVGLCASRQVTTNPVLLFSLCFWQCQQVHLYTSHSYQVSYYICMHQLSIFSFLCLCCFSPTTNPALFSLLFWRCWQVLDCNLGLLLSHQIDSALSLGILTMDLCHFQWCMAGYFHSLSAAPSYCDTWQSAWRNIPLGFWPTGTTPALMESIKVSSFTLFWLRYSIVATSCTKMMCVWLASAAHLHTLLTPLVWPFDCNLGLLLTHSTHVT